jgi:FkbM family methyltransferase
MPGGRGQTLRGLIGWGRENIRLLITKLRSLVRRALIRRLDVPDISNALRRLAGNGFSPEFIFDVGAYRGDFAEMALSVWPNAKVACFEPLPHGRAQIADLQKRLPGIDLHATLVGATEFASVPMHVAKTSSSLLKDAHNADFPVETFPQTTLSAIIRSIYSGRVPDLLKLDVQGYELEVLKGCEPYLRDVRVILTELSLLDLHENVPLMHELVGWLAQRGFVAYDICGMTRRPMDQALWQADMILVRHDDSLRRDKGYFPGKSWIR